MGYCCEKVDLVQLIVPEKQSIYSCLICILVYWSFTTVNWNKHNRPADGLLLPLPRLADDGGRRKWEPGLPLVVDGGGGINLTSGGDRSPPVVVLSPRFSATPQITSNQISESQQDHCIIDSKLEITGKELLPVKIKRHKVTTTSFKLYV